MRRLVSSGLTVLVLVTGARCQMLDRNCFGEEDEGELTATFLASKNEEAQALVYSGERAFSVNLIKALFEKYENESIEENIFISPSSIYHTVKRMTPETLQGVMGEIQTGFYKVEKLDVLLPKFSISGDLELLQPLSSLGINSLFGGQSNLTGFMDQYGDSEDSISLDSAKHKSFIEVNEEGSEAAAATALLGFRSARPLFHSEFKADHPFLFLIYDKQVDTILFFGVYQHPPSP